MTDKEKIRAEIERLKETHERNLDSSSSKEQIRIDLYPPK